MKIYIIKWEKLLKGPIDLVQFSLLHKVSKILVNNCLLTFLPTFLLSYLKENENTQFHAITKISIYGFGYTHYCNIK